MRSPASASCRCVHPDAQQPDDKVGVVGPPQLATGLGGLPALDGAHVGLPAQFKAALLVLDLFKGGDGANAACPRPIAFMQPVRVSQPAGALESHSSRSSITLRSMSSPDAIGYASG